MGLTSTNSLQTSEPATWPSYDRLVPRIADFRESARSAVGAKRLQIFHVPVCLAGIHSRRRSLPIILYRDSPESLERQLGADVVVEYVVVSEELVDQVILIPESYTEELSGSLLLDG